MHNTHQTITFLYPHHPPRGSTEIKTRQSLPGGNVLIHLDIAKQMHSLLVLQVEKYVGSLEVRQGKNTQHFYSS